MTFEEALQAMREGKKVRSESWGNKHYYYKMEPTIIDVHKKPVHSIEVADMIKNDWEIIT